MRSNVRLMVCFAVGIAVGVIARGVPPGPAAATPPCAVTLDLTQPLRLVKHDSEPGLPSRWWTLAPTRVVGDGVNVTVQDAPPVDGWQMSVTLADGRRPTLFAAEVHERPSRAVASAP